MMIRDVTADAKARLPELEDAVEALTVLNKLFFRQETRSAALGEISESLIAKYTGALRTKPSTKGHDLLVGDRRIEVKSRIIDTYADITQFNFREHTKSAHDAYCVAWRIDASNRPVLEHVYEVGVPFLISTWGTPGQDGYCARTTLGKLKAALTEFE